MRKIFIDIGSHVGESVRYFRKHYDPNHEYEIFCFEPLPENIEKLREIKGINLIEAAACALDGYEPLYTGMTESGSLSKEKRSGKLDGRTHVMVRTIRFTRWFAELLSPLHTTGRPDIGEIVIKLNCEGAEYDTLLDMQTKGQLPFVKKWFINWHYLKIGLDVKSHNYISGLVKYETWPAMFEK